jgi:diguanylate cyclase (GGDEF)-like protein
MIGLNHMMHHAIGDFLFHLPPDRSQPEQRRARVLCLILLALIGLLGVTLVEVLAVTGNAGSRGLYTGLILILLVLLVLAFFFNRSGHYSIAAQITVACGMAGPWGAVLLDHAILQGDYIPLVYTSLALFLAAILLPVRLTVILSAIQFLALLGLSFFLPNSHLINWPSLLAFILFTSILCIIATLVSSRDLEQIEKQIRLLAVSEAQMRELSQRDGLTGLYNRRFMEETLDQQLLSAAQKQTPVSVVMVDIDHFKNFNDLYGHIEGDAMLRLIGAVLRTHIRKSDVVCRFGGEEFVLILPDAALDAAHKRAERLREEVQRIQEENRDQIPGQITLSLGVACFPQHGQHRITLLRTADEALYRAKHAGRDRVVVAS